MFIASHPLNNPRALQRDNSVGQSYKHRAPPEQGPEQQKAGLFRAKQANHLVGSC